MAQTPELSACFGLLEDRKHAASSLFDLAMGCFRFAMGCSRFSMGCSRI